MGQLSRSIRQLSRNLSEASKAVELALSSFLDDTGTVVSDGIAVAKKELRATETCVEHELIHPARILTIGFSHKIPVQTEQTVTAGGP